MQLNLYEYNKNHNKTAKDNELYILEKIRFKHIWLTMWGWQKTLQFLKVSMI